MERLLLIVVPVLALTAFIVVRIQYGQIVPAPPVTVEESDDHSQIATTPRALTSQPTVLEAKAVDDGEALPPGIAPMPTMTPGAVPELELHPATERSTNP